MANHSIKEMMYEQSKFVIDHKEQTWSRAEAAGYSDGWTSLFSRLRLGRDYNARWPLLLLPNKDSIMNASELIRRLAPLGEYRISIYLSIEKMEHWYLLKVSPIIDLSAGEALTGDIEASLLGLVKSKAGGQKTTEWKVAIEKPVVQGVVAENVARASKMLVDLSSMEPKKGELLYYLGPARITSVDAPVVPDNANLDDGESSAVELQRRKQELVLQLLDPNARKIALTFKANGQAFASICSLKSVNLNALSRYSDQERFGILCTMEKTDGDVVFLDPLWIWHEGAA